MFLSIYFVGYSSWKRPKSLKHIEVYPPYESVTKEQLFQIAHDIYIYFRLCFDLVNSIKTY